MPAISSDQINPWGLAALSVAILGNAFYQAVPRMGSSTQGPLCHIMKTGCTTEEN